MFQALSRGLSLLVVAGLAAGCGAGDESGSGVSSVEQPTSNSFGAQPGSAMKQRSIAMPSKQETAPAARDSKLEELTKTPGWHPGWTNLVVNNGIEYGQLPWGKQPASINAVEMRQQKAVKMTDYWLRDTGWTTMWGHTLEKFTNKNYRTDGVRWDTPTSWVPKMANGGSTAGNMTLMTQYSPDVPNYWQGATPMAPQTDWVFSINYQNGGIMEIHDRHHFKTKSDGTLTAGFAEVVSTGYDKSIFWSLPKLLKIGASPFGGAADFVGNKGERFSGYTSVAVTNRFETFTIPPSRHRGGDCPAATFKDVIAVRHQQWWYDATKKTSRGDFLVLYMAKGVGWIHQLINDSVVVDASGNVTKDATYFLHMSPVGYIKQGANWVRRCPGQFRDIVLGK